MGFLNRIGCIFNNVNECRCLTIRQAAGVLLATARRATAIASTGVFVLFVLFVLVEATRRIPLSLLEERERSDTRHGSITANDA
jgi:hypothetical protein